MFDAMRMQMEKNLLRYAVQRLIFCPACEVVMDMRKVASMEFTEVATGKVLHTAYLCCACLDKTRPKVEAALQAARGDTVTMTVTDARDVYKRPAKKRA